MSYTMEVNIAKNQVIVKAYGLTESDVPAYIADFENALKQLKPGFTGVTDVTGSPTVLAPEVAAMLAPTGDRAIEAGVGGWVYVADSPVWKMQMKRLFGKFAVHYPTYQEADAYLSSLGNQSVN
ncbi:MULTISPECIES: hypothetical protein [unclassified Paenibacillus]|uniref:hypothetical protein n=1 Tax=unclassified Paenibacillus TaxID=185978 RepID=UPI0003E23E62|nr:MULTISPECIES: hypothetical protein [unclassified Paenibacillus]ETT44240.1 hypothetical protein C162_23640 [Paenibacillus sp. FSL R7-269]OMF99772.1 hypothetical protein BK147_05440 [Paenibacillus sp. FSL R7-0337]